MRGDAEREGFQALRYDSVSRAKCSRVQVETRTYDCRGERRGSFQELVAEEQRPLWVVRLDCGCLTVRVSLTQRSPAVLDHRNALQIGPMERRSVGESVDLREP